MEGEFLSPEEIKQRWPVLETEDLEVLFLSLCFIVASLALIQGVTLQEFHSPWPTMQLGGPVLKASGRVQQTPFGPGDKSIIITDWHTAGG